MEEERMEEARMEEKRMKNVISERLEFPLRFLTLLVSVLFFLRSFYLSSIRQSVSSMVSSARQPRICRSMSISSYGSLFVYLFLCDALCLRQKDKQRDK